MRSALLVTCMLVACGSGEISGGFDGGVPPTGDGGVPPTSDGGVQSDASQPMSGYVDPSCVDGLYNESLPDVNANISDVVFDGDVGKFVDDILARRYPVGAQLVAGGRTNTSFGADCDVLFGGSPSSAGDVFSSLATIVHECGHLYDFTLNSGATSGYYITDALTLSCDRGDTTDRGGDTFARSLINGDAYSALRPPCPNAIDCDWYAPIYLDGDPTNQSFEGGDQGFNLLFEETTQYVNSLSTEWAVVDQMSATRRTSARDGILTFLWWVERYLRMARLDYPGAYQRITDPCWRNAILTMWGRAWLYLEATDSMTQLGIDDVAILELVSDSDLLGEIERLRELEGC